MARQYSRSRSGAPFRRRYKPAIIRTASAPKRWQSANFLVDTVAVIDSDEFFTQAVSLIQIDQHLGSTMGTGEQGRVIESISRKIEIGGMVWGHYFKTELALPGTNDSGMMIHSQYLVFDRLDALGLPNSIPDWSQTTSPISTSLGPEDEDTQFPLRVIWSDYFTPVNTGLGSAAQSPHANNVNVHISRTQSLRIKRSVDDFQGLFYHFYTLGVANDDATTVRWGIAGRIYYRVRF